MTTKSLRILTASAISLALAVPATVFAGGGKDGKAHAGFFQKADTNGDGALSQSEVGDKRWQRLKNADSNKDGKVTKDEMKAAWEARKEARFKEADKNGDGALSQSEVGDQHWQRMQGADSNKDGKVTKDEMKAAWEARKEARFKQVDKNGDGVLTQSEVGAQRWEHLKSADTNKDGKITKDEMKAAFKGHGGIGFRHHGPKGRDGHNAPRAGKPPQGSAPSAH